MPKSTGGQRQRYATKAGKASFRESSQSIWDFGRGCDPCGKAGPGLVAKKLCRREGSLGRGLTEFGIQVGIVEACFSCVFGSCAVKYCIEPSPVRSRKTHRTWLATGV